MVWALLSNKSKLIYREGVFRPLKALMMKNNFDRELEPKVTQKHL